MFSPRLLLALGCGLLLACSTTDDEDRGGVTSDAKRQRWQPASVAPPNGTGTYDGIRGERCAGGLRPGARELGDRLEDQFRQITTVSGYSCRSNTAKRSQLSVHAVGRALDLMTRNGDPIADYLVTNARVLGVQMVIWNRTVWRITSSGPTSRAYTGPNPHTDHVHVELTREAAASGPGDVEDPQNGELPEDYDDEDEDDEAR